MGLGKFLKKAANVVLPNLGIVGGAANGLIQGGGLSGALKGGLDGGLRAGATMLGGPIGGSLGIGATAGSALAGAGAGALGAKLTGGDPLTGAISGGVGGLFSGGGFSDLLNTTGLSGSLNSAGNYLGFGDVISPAADAARSATATAATGGSSGGGILSNYLPAGGTGGTSGGTSGGFLDSIFGSSSGGAGPLGLEVGKAYDFTNTPWLSDVATGGLSATPGVDYATALGGASTVAKSASPSIAGSLLKYAAPYALQKDNARGYGQVQQAGTNAAAAYQPFLDSGTKATKTLADLYGLNGTDAAAAAMPNIENTPGYQFARDQGIQALDASAASRGMLRSGNQERAVQQFGTGLAQQYYQQFLNDLVKQQALGQNAADGVATGNMTAADAYAQLKGQKANSYNQTLYGLSQYL